MAKYGLQEVEIFRAIQKDCLNIFRENPTRNVSEIAIALMSRKDVPIHFPYHHYIIPAALLTATATVRNDSEERLEEMLEEARERAMEVPGGSCGFFGTCGAGVGTGIFISVYTDSGPLSVKSWGWSNELTGKTLQAIGEISGPRCCKRTCFQAIRTAVPYINEKLGTDLEFNEEQKCTFYEQNPQCKRRLCPFYPGDHE